MKNKFFKITGFIAFAAMVIILPGCLKENDATYTDFSKTGETVILQNSGLGNFKAANVDPYSADTNIIEIVAQLNSEYAIGADISVTIGVDDAKRVAYNASTTPPSNFLLMLPDMYKIKATQLIIKAGQRLALTTVEIYSAKITAQDPDKSWMLPISITNASGKTLSSNFNTMYINVIGNPIAGPYLWDFYRWNLTALQSAIPPTPPNGGTFLNNPTTFVPVNGTSVLVPSGYFIQPNYLISFTNTGGVLSNFTAVINGPDNDELIARGVTVVDGPNLLIADPITKRYKIQYQVFNGTAYRYIIDEFHK